MASKKKKLGSSTIGSAIDSESKGCGFDSYLPSFDFSKSEYKEEFLKELWQEFVDLSVDAGQQLLIDMGMVKEPWNVLLNRNIEYLFDRSETVERMIKVAERLVNESGNDSSTDT